MRTKAIALSIGLYLSARSVLAQPKEGSKRRVEWNEIAVALEVLPKKAPERGGYFVPKEKAQEFRQRVEALKEKGDIVPAVVERLNNITPAIKTEEEKEAEVLNLVRVLKEIPDERALPVLEQIAQSTPTTQIHMRDLGTFYRYPFQKEAKKLVWDIRVKQEQAKWGGELEGQDKVSRIKSLADAYWSPTEVDQYRWLAASALLQSELSPDERLAELESRVPALIDASTPWKNRRITHAVEELARLARAGARREDVTRLLEVIINRVPVSERANYARANLENLQRYYWHEKSLR